MTLDKFLDGVFRNINRVRSYRLGGDGSDSTCDCIGLIIGAIRLSGGKWTGTHGSNYSARYEMSSLKKINSIAELNVGDIVYKAKSKGESGWALPSKYANHKDQNDYYHVGVVTSKSPFKIHHCTGVAGGIKTDTTLGKWNYFGQLTKIDGTTPVPTPTPDIPKGTAMVTGGKLRLRKDASVSSKELMMVNDGEIVELLPDSAEWSHVKYKGVEGYMLSAFLKKGGNA